MSEATPALTQTTRNDTWKEKQTCDTFCKEVLTRNRHKIMFTLFNVFFIGISFCYFFNGFYYWLYREEVDPDNSLYLFIISLVLLLTAVCVFTASVLGTIGYFLSKIWMLKCMFAAHIYAALVFFGLSIYIGLHLIPKVENATRRYLEERYYLYYYDFEARMDIDDLQIRLECCGLYGPRTFPRNTIPASCCMDSKSDCNSLYEYKTHCYRAYSQYSTAKLKESMWFTIFLGLLHIFGGIATYFPAVMIKKRIPDTPEG